MAYDTRHRTRVRLLTGRMDFASNENREVAGSDDGIGKTPHVSAMLSVTKRSRCWASTGAQGGSTLENMSCG